MSFKKQSERRVSNPEKIPDGVLCTVLFGKTVTDALRSGLIETCSFHIVREIHTKQGVVLEVYYWFA